MLTFDDFETRVEALWQSQKRMAAPKKWKSGVRAGTIRKQPVVIEFTRDQLGKWLWTHVGVNAAQCFYCRVPIDILSLTLDHAMPRKKDGRFSLDNMRICCKDCNESKGDLTSGGFESVLRFARQELSPYDGEVLLKRMAAAHHGSPARFFRKPQGQQQAPKVLPAAKQNAMDFKLGAF